MFHVFKEEYKDAKLHIMQSKELFNKLDTSKPLLYCKVKKENLNGYCVACEVPVDGHKSNLTHLLLRSIKEQYSVSN